MTIHAHASLIHAQAESCNSEAIEVHLPCTVSLGFLYFALKLKTDIILSGEEGGICPAEDVIDSRLCFYDVLADHYVRMPESGQRILDLIVQLWSQLFVSHIFALLFHKWVCELV